MKERSKRYLENKFIHTIKAVKDGYRTSAKDYLTELQGIISYLYVMDEISEYNYLKLYKLTYLIKNKYNLY